MSSEWQKVRLDHIADVNPTRKVRKGSIVPFVDMAALPQNSRDISSVNVIAREAKGAGAHFQNGDTLLARITPCLENGKTAQVRCLESTAVAEGSTEFIVLCGKDPADNDFIYYLCREPEFREYAIGRMEGTSGRQRVSWQSIAAYELSFLPPIERRAAARVLTALDDRITLLRETNATLEAIAQTLFKSWFVNFDPVRAKSEGRAPEGMDEATAALFPDSFEESAMGLVPTGWRVQVLGELCSVTIGGLWGNDERDDAELVPAISLRGVDLEHLRAEGYAKNAPTRWVKPSAMDKRRLCESEVLIASSGAGPCGRPLWAGAGFEALYGMPVIFSNFVKRLDCGSPARAIYIDRLLAEMRETREIWNYINGTSIPNLDDRLLLATKKVIVPDKSVLSEFEGVARAIYERLYSQKAQTLATLRDTLLPRLISGQLRLQLHEEIHG